MEPHLSVCDPSTVSRIVSIDFPTLAETEGVRAELRRLSDEGLVAPEDVAIVVKGADGRIEVRQARQLSVGEGLVGGGTFGLLVGLALALPVGGALLGVAAGGAVGARDTGLPDERVAKLGERLDAGHAALVTLVPDGQVGVLEELARRYGGEAVVAAVPAPAPAL
jgi:uncharacterized membrane protein